MTQYLEEILKRLKILANQQTTKIHKDCVQVIMSQFRQHLEALRTESKYPVLMFYCNWNLHKDLNRGIVQDILEKISIAITDEKTGHPADNISAILGLSDLRLEIIKILESDADVKSGIFDIKANWIAFTELMFPFILSKPLVRTRKPKTHHWVESLELYDNKGKLFWKIKVSPGDSTFSGPLMRTDLF
jgi:hypothetical protein